MRYLSVCSGIEAASVAWKPLNWQPVAFSEIEPAPCRLLAHHYPDVPNFGDMTKFKDWPDREQLAIDLLCGGTPCQSFSVAGLRKGLDDPRGNLMLTYLAIADKYRPTWLVWENVPGVLSSNGGRDFGAFLGGLGQLGYGFAYRTLDAQYFGVAQRRRRVFVVGHLGDWRRAAAVLFEQHSLSGHPAPRRQTRESIAGTIGARTGLSVGAQDAACGHMLPVQTVSLQGRDRDGTAELGDDIANALRASQGGGDKPHALIHDIAGSITAAGGRSRGAGQDTAYLIPEIVGQAMSAKWPAEIASCLNAHFGEKQGLEDQHINSGAPLFVPHITHSLRGEGFDASEDGTGRVTPLVPVYSIHPVAQAVAYCREVAQTITQNYGKQVDNSDTALDPNIIAFDTTQITSAANRSNPQSGDPCHPLAAGAHAPAIAIPINDMATRHAGKNGDKTDCGKGNGFGVGSSTDPMFTLTKGDKHAVAIGFQSKASPCNSMNPGEVMPTLDKGKSDGLAVLEQHATQPTMRVRRLTPRECERLQGFQWPVSPDHPSAWQDAPVQWQDASGAIHEIPGRWWSPDCTAVAKLSDSARYKALGNSWAVPCARWIGERINAVNQIPTATPTTTEQEGFA